MTHICVSKLTIIGSDNGLSPCRCQAIIWTNAGILLIRTLGTNFSEIWSKFHKFSFMKTHLKMSSGKWRTFCLGLNVLRMWIYYITTSNEHVVQAYHITVHWQLALAINSNCLVVPPPRSKRHTIGSRVRLQIVTRTIGESNAKYRNFCKFQQKCVYRQLGSISRPYGWQLHISFMCKWE